VREASSADPEGLDCYSVEDLAHACAQRASWRDAPTPSPDPCYELFRRAFAHVLDNDAWCAILSQYQRLVRHWLGQYASEDTCQDVFIRFWKAQQDEARPFATRFPNTSAAMAYLRRCAIAVRIEGWREEERANRAQERLQATTVVASHNGEHPSDELKQLVLSRLNDERERVVVDLTWRYHLKPGEVQAERPDLFPDVGRVYRVKENLMKRLRRDLELAEWWKSVT
jgi:DNA-directed RNA polymerase specialized sigma24 family protein